MVDIVYTALAALLVVVVLHIAVFSVTRFIQPPKPKVVYLPAPVQQQQPILVQPQQLVAAPPLQAPVQPPPPQQAPPPPSVTLPTYDAPPPKPSLPSLPPPIETRESRQTGLPTPGLN